MNSTPIPPSVLEEAADKVVEALEGVLASHREIVLPLVFGNDFQADTVISASLGRAFVRASLRMVRRECGKVPPYNVVADMIARAGRQDGPLLAELRREYARGGELD